MSTDIFVRLVTLVDAPDGQEQQVRADAILAASSPFLFAPGVMVRTIRLLGGATLSALDTPANAAAISAALNPAGAAVRPTPSATVRSEAGAVGKTGPAGKNGAPGAPGADGPRGATGSPGCTESAITDRRGNIHFVGRGSTR